MNETQGISISSLTASPLPSFSCSAVLNETQSGPAEKKMNVFLKNPWGNAFFSLVGWIRWANVWKGKKVNLKKKFKVDWNVQDFTLYFLFVKFCLFFYSSYEDPQEEWMETPWVHCTRAASPCCKFAFSTQISRKDSLGQHHLFWGSIFQKSVSQILVRWTGLLFHVAPPMLGWQT